MSSLDNELDALRRAPAAALDLSWLTDGSNYTPSDASSRWNQLPNVNAQTRFNRTADPAAFRAVAPRDLQNVCRVVLAALHAGYQGKALDVRLFAELGQVNITRFAPVIQQLVAAYDGLAGVVFLDPSFCWPSCGDVVRQASVNNPFRKTASARVKALSACAGCVNRTGNQCTACGGASLFAGDDLPAGTLSEVVTHADLPAGLGARVASTVTGNTETDRVRGFVRGVFAAIIGEDAARRAAVPAAAAFSLCESEAVVDTGPSFTASPDVTLAEAELGDFVTAGKSPDVTFGADEPTDTLDQLLTGGTPPRLLEVDGYDSTGSREKDITVKARPQADGISVVLDDEMDITL